MDNNPAERFINQVQKMSFMIFSAGYYLKFVFANQVFFKMIFIRLCAKNT